MAHQWSSKSRSPVPLWTPTQFFPPSHFAAAAGVPYPPNRDDDGTTPSTPAGRFQQDIHSLSSPLASNTSRPRRRSRLDDFGLLEPHLLPTLSDTVERMTRPPSQTIPSSPLPFGPSSKPDFSASPVSVARAPSTSSQSSSAYSVRSEHHTVMTPTIRPTSGKQCSTVLVKVESKVDTKVSYDFRPTFTSPENPFGGPWIACPQSKSKSCSDSTESTVGQKN
ncbi:hypothetical protein JVU11DRAFT_6894 [Chiua virens]|nr:hypothetical protein JVU11DRAFT_6894 [Chiua virens]